LLPTITPPRLLELHPIATLYYYDTEQLVLSGITYTTGTEAGFGEFQFVDRWMEEGRVPSQFVVMVTPDTE
jgi:hypothetical protein